MAMTASRGSGKAIGDINVTPMADIMIVLLIIFMVMTPLIDDNGVRLPAAANAVDKNRDGGAIVVSIRRDATVALGTDPLDNLGELALRLTERLDTLPEGARLVQLRADDALPYSAVWKVLEICRQAGAEEVALLARRSAGEL